MKRHNVTITFRGLRVFGEILSFGVPAEVEIDHVMIDDEGVFGCALEDYEGVCWEYGRSYGPQGRTLEEWVEGLWHEEMSEALLREVKP